MEFIVIASTIIYFLIGFILVSRWFRGEPAADALFFIAITVWPLVLLIRCLSDLVTLARRLIIRITRRPR